MDSVSKYKPQVSLNELLAIDETQEKPELAFSLLKTIVVAKKVGDMAFMTIGRALKIIRDNKLYQYLDYEDFSQFLASEEISFSREKAYAMIRVYEIFVEKLEYNPDEIGKLGIARLMLMSPLVRGIEDVNQARKKVEELKDLRYNDFVKEVKEQINPEGKPNVYFSEEQEKWIVQYYEDKTILFPLGKYGNT